MQAHVAYSNTIEFLPLKKYVIKILYVHDLKFRDLLLIEKYTCTQTNEHVNINSTIFLNTLQCNQKKNS